MQLRIKIRKKLPAAALSCAVDRTVFLYHIKIRGRFQVRCGGFSAKFLAPCVEKNKDNNILCPCGKCGESRAGRLVEPRGKSPQMLNIP
ncbi:MAG: hypothetical protein PUC97_09610 [bacterium]|nr:hypothetical protein [bacterium]